MDGPQHDPPHLIVFFFLLLTTEMETGSLNTNNEMQQKKIKMTKKQNPKKVTINKMFIAFVSKSVLRCF